MDYFDGKKVRDEILEVVKQQIDKMSKQPHLAVIWIGDDFASARYIEAKQRAAEKVGIHFDTIKYSENAEHQDIKQKIKELSDDPEIDGIMIQVPVPAKFELLDLLTVIKPEKDIDGLRFCSELTCTFRPPVTLSILEAIRQSKAVLASSVVTVIGKGYLVGSPMERILKGKVKELRTADASTPYLGTLTKDSDIIISATGQANLIKPEMIKKGVVLIDAGTTELGGKLTGDIDPKCHKLAKYYTPVPGGIGPVTVAMLMANVVSAVQQRTEKNN